MKRIELKAMGKINLGLDVLGIRQDGYHEVRMIMQTVRLFDRIALVKKDKPGITVKTNLYYLPTNENNLVYKAARMLLDEFEIGTGVEIRLEKHIPVSAGMAGGSTDAASVLFGMNQMFRLGLSKEQLMERGVKIGADVPYCVMRGTALAEGIGEELTALPPMPECQVLIAKPGVSVSTKFVYQQLDSRPIGNHPDIDRILEGIRRQDLHMIAGNLGNVLESVTIPEYPVIAQIKKVMMEYEALNAMMSGSGPTVFGLFDDPGKARGAYQKLKNGPLAKQVYLTGVFNTRR